MHLQPRPRARDARAVQLAHCGRVPYRLHGALDFGGTPRRAVLAFDPAGSYSVTYAAQGADRGFVMGLTGKPLTEESFFTALKDAAQAPMEIAFEVRKLAESGHPNTVDMDLTGGDGSALRLVARSIGGGEVQITRLDGREVLFNGSACDCRNSAVSIQGLIHRSEDRPSRRGLEQALQRAGERGPGRLVCLF